MTSVPLRVSVMPWLAVLLAAFTLPASAVAQAASPAAVPLRGVVWEIPPDAERAAADLRRMAAIGVRAVRTDLVEDPRLLALADALGLQVFQELPLAFVAGPNLAEALAQVRPRLDAALAQARPHPSARYFGLARSADTSDPAACEALAATTAAVRDALPGAQTYYVTPFIVDDQCGEAVDFVLLDVLGGEAPVRQVAAWREAHADVAVGIGALGTWTGDGQGLKVPHSPEAQARYLENTLGAVLADSVAVAAVFVHRWRDRARQEASLLPALQEVRGRRYGLLTQEDDPRPAFAVVRGLYTGTQAVFAFEQGTAEAPSTAWAVLLGWGVVLLLGIFYALSPRFRHMVPRYFRAHGFYQEAVREGRDVLLGTSAVLLLALSVSVGLIVTVAARVLQEERAFALLLRWLPDGVQTGVIDLIVQPFALVFLCASVYAVSLLIWASVLSIASRRRHLLAPGQAVMLIVWPRWTTLLLAAGAIAVSTLPPEMARDGVYVLLAAWALTVLYAGLRTLYDYMAITRVPAHILLVAAMGNPVVLLLVVGCFVALEHRTRVAFLLHLALRG